MSFDWSERYQVARALVGLSYEPVSDEVYQRVAINSAYYAAYKSASNFLRDSEAISIPTLDAHWFVVQQFRSSRQKQRQLIADDLETLRRLRNEVDYDNVINGLPNKLERDCAGSNPPYSPPIRTIIR